MLSGSPTRRTTADLVAVTSSPTQFASPLPRRDHRISTGPAMTAPKTGAHLNVWQAAFIGVAAMVGAGIFSLLGAAGEVAGAAVWLSFLIAGAIAMLQGYSFAKFGARYPSAGGILEYVLRGFGD